MIRTETETEMQQKDKTMTTIIAMTTIIVQNNLSSCDLALSPIITRSLQTAD